MELPLVIVITVCRNALTLLEETILSVLGQTYPNVKYIIIDGASSDGTIDIIKNYEDELAYWISEPDKGIYDAMNKGLAKARAIAKESDCWVNFMNAGDAFAENTVIEEIFNKTIPEDTKIIGGNTINVFQDGHQEIHHAEPSTVIPQRLPFSHQAMFARIDADNQWTFNIKYKYAADYAFLYKTFWKYGADSIMTLDKAIAKYRQEDSLSMVNAKKVTGEYLSIQASHRSWSWWKTYLKWILFR